LQLAADRPGLIGFCIAAGEQAKHKSRR
jgi:hypothetical protein